MPFDMSPEDVETVTKPEVFSLEGLIAWLETQNTATEYNYMDSNDCVMCRYFTARGIRHDGVVFTNLIGVGEFPEAMKLAAQGIFGSGPDRWTYGAALRRARALLSKP